jgi:hypothetical protein
MKYKLYILTMGTLEQTTQLTTHYYHHCLQQPCGSWGGPPSSSRPLIFFPFLPFLPCPHPTCWLVVANRDVVLVLVWTTGYTFVGSFFVWLFASFSTRAAVISALHTLYSWLVSSQILQVGPPSTSGCSRVLCTLSRSLNPPILLGLTKTDSVNLSSTTQ